MTRVARSGLVFLAAAAAVIGISSCRREAPDNIDRNRPPETYITKAPAESTLSYYRVHFYWGGADPDGEIAYYEVAVTDSNRVPGQDTDEGTGYTRTLATDSLFTLVASPPVEQQIIGKRVYVRAVDNEGKFDPTPARAFFQSRNDCYPEVIFNRGRATWIDKCGVLRERVLVSSSESVPTDTVGVGANICWSWRGTDCDPDGFVTGFEYKLGSQPRYRGGTLADTSYCITLSPTASRVQLLQVRAIDDGGLRTAEDSTQSVVVNFDPVTLVVDPPVEGDMSDPERHLVFQFNGLTYPSGTILPDRPSSVIVYFTGLDDPRDLQPSCLSTGLSRYQTRRGIRDNSVGNFAFPPWEDVQPRDGFPIRNQQQYNGLVSGDHLIQLRAIDVSQIVDSKPESVLVKVNYPPYLIRLTARASTSPESEAVDLLPFNSQQPISINFPAGDTILVVTALGSDIHMPPPNTSPFDPSTVIGEETGTLADSGYRIFFQSSFLEPSFEMTPPAQAPFVKQLVVSESADLYPLAVHLIDRTFFNPNTGRVTRILRQIRIVRQAP
ncbi:MAG: hypothetical protein SGI90_06010 [Candidatus Eisenbacteria bacterium]|nr:hypothetical protein [Candidatus Eisenbacteria bacterium]